MRTPYLEHCPECRDAVRCQPVNRQRSAGFDGSPSVVAFYRCPVCLYSWRTWWQPEVAR